MKEGVLCLITFQPPNMTGIRKAVKMPTANEDRFEKGNPLQSKGSEYI